MLRRIYYQIHALAPTLVRLRSTGVYHSPGVPPECNPLSESRLVQGIEMSASSGGRAVKARFLLGEYEDPQGHAYLMLVNKDLSHSFQIHIRLKQAGRV